METTLTGPPRPSAPASRLQAAGEGLLVAAVLAMCLAVGWAFGRSPAVAAAVALATGALALGLAVPGALSRAFLVALGLLLAGYAFFCRGFAYLGAPPLFVGEMVLGLGILAAVLDRRRTEALRSPLTWLLAALAFWGGLRTVPYLAEHGVDALRDAVIWGYGIFAVLVVPVLVRDRRVERLPAAYARLLPWFVMWAPLAVVITRLWSDRLPLIPGTDLPVIDVKPGDVNVHLAGVAAFLLLGLHHPRPDERARRIPLPEVLLWVVWLCGFVVSASINRGGLLAVLSAIGVALVLRPFQGLRRIALLGTIAFLIAGSLIAFDVSVPAGGDREISPRQIAENVASIAGHTPGEERDGTRAWRLAWWGKIVGYTVTGEHFWTGKGFGINLADDDGFQVHRDGSLRSPHNGHLTILARSGVPGLALWLLLQGGFALALLRACIRARRAGEDRWLRLFAWILAYWTGFMVNATFDVFLEGPQGGIWFWSIFGAGVAALLVWRRSPRAAAPSGAPSGPYGRVA